MQHNFYTTIKPFTIFLSCMGILPCCFRNNKLFASYIRYLYVLLLIATDFAFYYLYYNAMELELQLQQTSRVSERILTTVTTVQVTVTLIYSVMGKKKYVRFAKTMLNCEHNFKEITDIPYKLVKRKIYIHIILWTLVIVINLIAQLSIQEEFGFTYTANNINYGYVWILNGCVCIFSVVHISAIRRGFCVINECLRRMQKNNAWAEFEYEQYLRWKIWNSNVQNLAKIGSLHLELCDCMREFNDTMGVILVAKYFMAFVALLMGLYFGYVSYQQSQLVYAFCSTFAALSYAASLTVLCQNCSSTINEVKICNFHSSICCFYLVLQCPLCHRALKNIICHRAIGINVYRILI